MLHSEVGKAPATITRALTLRPEGAGPARGAPLEWQSVRTWIPRRQRRLIRALPTQSDLFCGELLRNGSGAKSLDCHRADRPKARHPVKALRSRSQRTLDFPEALMGQGRNARATWSKSLADPVQGLIPWCGRRRIGVDGGLFITRFPTLKRCGRRRIGVDGGQVDHVAVSGGEIRNTRAAGKTRRACAAGVQDAGSGAVATRLKVAPLNTGQRILGRGVQERVAFAAVSQR